MIQKFIKNHFKNTQSSAKTLIFGNNYLNYTNHNLKKITTKNKIKW